MKHEISHLVYIYSQLIYSIFNRSPRLLSSNNNDRRTEDLFIKKGKNCFYVAFNSLGHIETRFRNPELWRNSRFVPMSWKGSFSCRSTIDSPPQRRTLTYYHERKKPVIWGSALISATMPAFNSYTEWAGYPGIVHNRTPDCHSFLGWMHVWRHDWT